MFWVILKLLKLILECILVGKYRVRLGEKIQYKMRMTDSEGFGLPHFNFLTKKKIWTLMDISTTLSQATYYDL